MQYEKSDINAIVWNLLSNLRRHIFTTELDLNYATKILT